MSILRILKTILKPIWRVVKYSTLAAFRLSLFLFPVDSEAWYWLRELITWLPGATGVAFRGVFYNRYFKRKSKDIVIDYGVCIEHPQNIEMGDRVVFARNVWIDAQGGLTIGDNCGFGPYTIIHTANHNFYDPKRAFMDQGSVNLPVRIESDVWLAASVRVLPGTHIGYGVVVIANTAVSGNIEPYAIMGGGSSRKIGSRKPPLPTVTQQDGEL